MKQGDNVQEWVNNSCMRPNVMNSFPSQRLLVLAGTIASSTAIIMIDSGASRNFLSTKFTQKISVKIDRTLKDKIRLADGHQVHGEGTAKSLRFHIGAYTASANFSVTQLTQGYDAILGKTWLTRVNPQIDWKSNIVTIKNKQGTVQLKGISSKGNG